MLQRLEVFKNKEMMKSIYTLAWPTMIQEALGVLVQYVDTAMVGMIGASASAVVGLTGSLNWLVNSICMAFGIGVLALIAKSLGANQGEKARVIAIQSIYITIVVGSVVGILAVLCSYPLPGWLGASPSIHHDASLYFRIISLPMLFRCAIFVFSCVLRGCGDTKTPMFVSILMNVINIVLNFLFIYPSREIFGISIWGANLGTTGAAIGSAISFIVGGVLMTYFFFNNKKLRIRKQKWHFNKVAMKDCLSIGTPVCMERIVICGGHVTFASLVSRLGVLPLAAHSIALTAEQAFYVPGYGMQGAASTLAGNALGQKDEKRIKDITFALCAISFSILAVLGVLLFIFAPMVMQMFTQDQQVIALGTDILRIVSISEPLFGILIILEGIFNGMGDTKAPFVYSCITMWGIRVLGSIFVIEVLQQGIEAVWIMMVLDNVARCGFLLRRFLKGYWKKRLEIE